MGVQVLPAVTSVRGSEVVFENGCSHSFDAIVFATGFKRSTNKWLKVKSLLLAVQEIIQFREIL